MRLIRYGDIGRERPGVEINGQRYDCSSYFQDWDRKFFTDDGLRKLTKLVQEPTIDLPLVDQKQRWASPVARPGMIICVGLNYRDHAEESGMQIPSEPILFMKATNTISGPNDPVAIPRQSKKTDWEVELGIIIGKDALYLKDENEGQDAIAGYCVVNDLSERAFQLEQGGQWVKGKSCPGFTPVGPYMVTKDEIKNVLDLNMQLSVNGIVRQQGNTSTMIFDPAFIVYYISQYMTLEAGDIISTGTPPGVGLGMTPPTYLVEGDVVSLNIDKLGSQTQNFIST